MSALLAQSHSEARDAHVQIGESRALDVHRQLSDACYVRALYPFNSDELTSLSFVQGDLIRVLSKLDSGWWDGLLRGRRGWFPSNYVEEVEIVSSDDEDDPGDMGQRTETLSTASENHESEPSESDIHTRLAQATIGSDDGSEEAAFWIPHASSEGRIYYFNTITGATTWDIPYLPLSIVGNSRAIANRVAPLTTGIRPPPEDASAIESQNSPHDPSDEQYATGDAKSNPSPQISIHSGGWRDINGHDILAEEDSGFDEAEEEDDGEILLFATPEASANANDDSEARPSAMQHGSFTREPRQNHDLRLVTAPAASGSWLADLDLTIMSAQADELSAVYRDWTRQISKTVEFLSLLVTTQSKSEYETTCDELKNIISRMLQILGLIREYSTNVLESPSDPGQEVSNPSPTARKVQYRQIVAATSQVLLSAHIASDHWAPQDCAQRMLEDAFNLASLVDNLVTDIWDTHLDMVSLKPLALASRSVGGGWQGNALNGTFDDASNPTCLHGGKVKLCASSILNLENLASSVNDRQKACRMRLRQLEKSHDAQYFSIILSDIQHVTDDTMQVLQYCEQFDLSALERRAETAFEQSPTVTDFSKSKQLIYDAVGSLVLSAQSITIPDGLLQASSEHGSSINELRKALSSLEAALQSTILHAEFMVQEIETRSFPRTHSPEATLHARRDDKMRKLLGSDAPDTAVPPSQPSSITKDSFSSAKSLVADGPPQAQIPWFLENEFESDLSYDYKGNVKAGTLLALVERLTRHDLLDSMYNNTFLLTYRSFTTAEELSNLLIQRFTIEPPSGLRPEQLEIWVGIKQNPIRLRVFNVLKSWIENFFMEPQVEATREWLTKMQKFAENVMAEHISATPILLRLIEKRMHQGGVPFRRMVPNTTTTAPAPILPRNLRKMRLLDLDPLEVARQLTIMESTLYNRIKPTECLDKSWSKPDAAEGAENIKAMILRSNQITAWVAEAILYQTDLKKRVSLIKHFVHIAEKCRALHNFSTLTAIISGLNSAPIHRLRRTWDLLNARVAMSAEDLNRLMNSSKNFSQYREALHQMQPPCVPFLGVYLTDLTFIEDGNPDMSVKARHLINISKRQKTADVIRDIQQYQAVPYSLTVVPEIQDYIRSCMDITRDISELYDISLEREPREREDEKIARLLQESGFL